MSGAFIISSGRCGSTMMSNLINTHSDILSVSEFLIDVADYGYHPEVAFGHDHIDGEEFWRRLNLKLPLMNVMLQNDRAYKELLYPYRDSSSLFNAQTGVPVLSMTMLPHITKQPDELYEELKPVVCAQPVQGIRSHYEDFFGWLMAKFGNKIWVERSGGNIAYLEEMIRVWPQAKYIHVFRNGMDTAKSMSVHQGFKMMILAAKIEEFLGVNPYYSNNRDKIDKVPLALRCYLPESFDSNAFDAYTVPFDVIGGLWAENIERGFTQLATLPTNNVLHIDYDRFCENPETQLRTIVEFLGVECPNEWLRTAVANVNKSGGAWRQLPIDQQVILEGSCRLGMALIEQKLQAGLIL